MATEVEVVDSGNYTPESLRLRRRLAEAMMTQGTKVEPIGHWTQGVAKMIQALMGGTQISALEQKERDQEKARTQALLGLLPGGNAPAAATTTETAPEARRTAAAAAVTPSANPDAPLDMSLPRSVRTNNPGAMEYGPFTISQGATGTDGRYARFRSLEDGYRAQETLLRSYMARGFNTPAKIVGRWAPANVDNNSTSDYTNAVAKALGIGVNDPVPADRIGALAEAMAAYEAGRPVPRGGARVAQAPTASMQPTQAPVTTEELPQVPGVTVQPPDPLPPPSVQAQTPPQATQAPAPTAAPVSPAQAPAAAPSPSGPQALIPENAQMTPEVRARITQLMANPATRPLGEAMLMKYITPPAPVTPDQQSQIAHRAVQDDKARLEMEKLRREMPQDPARVSANLNQIVTDARSIRNLPGFDDALRIGNMSQNISIGGGSLGSVGGDVMALPRWIGRNIDRNNPAWAAYDGIQQAQSRLTLEAGRAFLKGQGQVSNFERQMVTDAIGDLMKATGAADYQFRLNRVQRMIDGIDRNGSVGNLDGTQPTQAEIASAIDTRANTFSTARIEDLARKYNVSPLDMQNYIVELDRRARGNNPSTVERARNYVQGIDASAETGGF